MYAVVECVHNVSSANCIGNCSAVSLNALP